jgi:hypothetical protein
LCCYAAGEAGITEGKQVTTDPALIELVASAIKQADKQFAAPCMVLKDEEAEVYAKAAIAAMESYDASLPSIEEVRGIIPLEKEDEL